MAVQDAPTRALGTLGPGTYMGWVDALADVAEHVPDLRYPASLAVLSKMRLDPTLKSILEAYIRPIVAAPWAVDPDGASEAHARAVADSLGLPLVGEDQKPGDARRRGVQWKTHVQLACSGMLTWGHMPFAPWYDVTSGKAVLAGLPERMPQSLNGLDVNQSTGELEAVRQASTMTSKTSADVVIPVKDLLFYVHDREGSAWFGRSMLRPAYAAWLLKQDTLRVHATTLRRFGAGTPTAETLPGAQPTAAEHQAAQQAVSSMRVGDSSGMTLGPGFRARILGIEGSIPDAMPFLRYLDEQMARMSLASVLDLGSTPNGSRALGAEFGDLLSQALNGIAGLIAQTASKLCVDLTDFNLGEDQPAPALVVGDVGANPQEVAGAIADLVQKGGLTMDPGLEDFVRDGLRLPAVPKPITTEPLPGAAPVAGAVIGPPLAVAASASGAYDSTGQPLAEPREVVGRMGPFTVRAAGDYAGPVPEPYRPLTPAEHAAGLDPATIDALTDPAVEQAVAAWAPIQQAQVEQILAAVRKAVDAVDLGPLAAFVPDTTAARAVLEQAMQDGYDVGTMSASSEAAAQGVQPVAAADAHQLLTGAAAAIALVLAGGLVASALRSAARWAGRRATTDDVVVAVRADLEALSRGYVEARLSAAVQQGLAEGRMAVQSQVPGPVVWVHTAVRDRNECSACAANDGHLYATRAQVEADFPTGGYALCQGRERCRCVTYLRVLPAEVAA